MPLSYMFKWAFCHEFSVDSWLLFIGFLVSIDCSWQLKKVKSGISLVFTCNLHMSPHMQAHSRERERESKGQWPLEFGLNTASTHIKMEYKWNGQSISGLKITIPVSNSV